MFYQGPIAARLLVEAPSARRGLPSLSQFPMLLDPCRPPLYFRTSLPGHPASRPVNWVTVLDPRSRFHLTSSRLFLMALYKYY